MKFAVVERERREAQPRLLAACPICSDVMIAKCGRHRVWHWAHRGTRTCDNWWEPETEWHRAWKKHFPKDWQEAVQLSDAGERHIADVKTGSGFVLEFQHSSLIRDERRSREQFYQKMVWVVDGRRRLTDRARFFAALRSARVIHRKPMILSLPPHHDVPLRDWEAGPVPVYIDFGDSEATDAFRFNHPTLWRLSPVGRNGWTYLSPIAKALFLHVHLNGVHFEDMCTDAIGRAAANYTLQQVWKSQPLTGFERHLARRHATQRRF